MVESKFAGIFDKGRTEAAPEQAEAPARVEKPAPIAEARRIGRPPGKRSDPAYKQYSVLLRRETQREAANLLREREGGPDLSGLVQKLLETWIKKQKS